MEIAALEKGRSGRLVCCRLPGAAGKAQIIVRAITPTIPPNFPGEFNLCRHQTSRPALFPKTRSHLPGLRKNKKKDVSNKKT